MAKKSFTRDLSNIEVNPASQFISAPVVTAPAPVSTPTEKKERVKKTASAKKISSPEVEKNDENLEIPEGYYLNPEFVEKKTKRFQALMKPSTYEKLKAWSESRGESMNELVNGVLEKGLREDGF